MYKDAKVNLHYLYIGPVLVAQYQYMYLRTISCDSVPVTATVTRES